MKNLVKEFVRPIVGEPVWVRTCLSGGCNCVSHQGGEVRRASLDDAFLWDLTAGLDAQWREEMAPVWAHQVSFEQWLEERFESVTDSSWV